MTTTITHTVLPQDARERLQKAAQTPVDTSDPNARIRAVEEATRWARDRYPQHFVPPEEGEHAQSRRGQQPR